MVKNIAKRFVSIALTSGLLLFLAGDVLHAEDIEGTIVRTLLLSEDTRLVGDVATSCQVEGAACIRFGAPGITLSLNGFTMTGLANATTGCSGANVTGEFGISTNNQSDVGIRGPGVVQRFRGVGIIFGGLWEAESKA